MGKEFTNSYIETIDECSMIDSFHQDDDQYILHDEPTRIYNHELQSTYGNPFYRSSLHD